MVAAALEDEVDQYVCRGGRRGRPAPGFQDGHAASGASGAGPARCRSRRFVDGVNVRVRLGEDPKLCLLVVIVVCEDGEQELLAIADSHRESEDSGRRCSAITATAG